MNNLDNIYEIKKFFQYNWYEIEEIEYNKFYIIWSDLEDKTIVKIRDNFIILVSWRELRTPGSEYSMLLAINRLNRDSNIINFILEDNKVVYYLKYPWFFDINIFEEIFTMMRKDLILFWIRFSNYL